MFTITTKLAWNAKRTKLVPYESTEARFLAYTPGQTIPMAKAKELGLLKGKGQAATKAAAPAEDKMADGGEDKGAAAADPAADGAPDSRDD